MLALIPLFQARDRRPGDRVASKAPEDIKHDPRIRRRVKARSNNTTTGLHSPTSRHHNVDALGIRLRTVLLARSVQRNDLVAQHVVARREVGDRQVPAKVVLDQVVSRPGAWVGAGFPRRRGDLGPLQGGWVGAAEVTGHGRDVFLYGADVADGPGVLRRGVSWIWDGRGWEDEPI